MTNINTTKKILSFDAETNGLWGRAFSIAAILEDGSTFIGRCPIEGEVEPWVAENVLPNMEGIEITHGSYNELLKSFAEFYLQNKKDRDVIVHMGLPVEARIFIDMHSLGFIGDWDAPYPLIDISAIPEIGTSVDSYNEIHQISVSKESYSGGTHNPLYDSEQALRAYRHATATK